MLLGLAHESFHLVMNEVLQTGGPPTPSLVLVIRLKALNNVMDTMLG